MKDIPDLHSTLRHPVRRRILNQLLGANSKPLTPKGLSVALKEPLSNISYHVRKLQKQEAIVLVDTEPIRGSIKHFYVAAPIIRDTDWIRASLKEHEQAEDEEKG